MANWVVAIDPNHERRHAFVVDTAVGIAPVDGLKVASGHLGSLSALWACAKTAPVDAQFTLSNATVVWGEPRDSSGKQATAEDLRIAWRDGAESQWDGFYAAFCFDPDGAGLTVGTDLMGIFPVYYWFGDEGIVLVATSMELFRLHPLFQVKFNEAGLIGVMLINNLLDGETLWRGVRRLSPGYRLRVSSGRVREELAYTIPFSDAYYDVPFEGQALRLSEALQASVARIAPAGRKYGLLLSGGHDSRMLAGYLVNQGSDVRALTFGQSKDIEMQCAKAVASSLGLTHDLFEVDPAEYVQAAERLARWEALAGGFGAVTEWASHKPISQAGDRVVSGHMLDGFVGGVYHDWAYDERLGRISFDAMFANAGSWGFDVPSLKALLQPELGVLVDEVFQKLRESYQASAPREDYRAWIFGMRNRMRYHVGSAVWVASLAAWPVLPFLSRELVATVAGIPCSSLSGRQLQKRILMRSFPKLAQLPIDRNSLDSRPIDPRLRHHLAHALGHEVRRLRNPLLKRLKLAPTERQYYRRTFGPNSPGWRAIRMHADACISKIPSAFRPEVFRALIPPVDATVDTQGSIGSMSHLRMLLGLALWGSCTAQA